MYQIGSAMGLTQIKLKEQALGAVARKQTLSEIPGRDCGRSGNLAQEFYQ